MTSGAGLTRYGSAFASALAFATLVAASCAQLTPSPSVPSAVASAVVATLSANDRQAIAAVLDVDSDTIVPTEDGAVAVVHRDGVTRLLIARPQDVAWSSEILAEMAEQVPAGAAYSSLASVDCSSAVLVRPRYLFGLFTDTTDRQLRLDGVRGLGGAITDSAWLFAIDPGSAANAPFKIFGVRPEPLYLGTLVDAAIPCQLGPAS